MKTYRVNVIIEVNGDEDDEDSFREAVKDSLNLAIDLDDSGDEVLEFVTEEIDEDGFNA